MNNRSAPAASVKMRQVDNQPLPMILVQANAATGSAIAAMITAASVSR
jgi:hypothetical protein